MTGIFIYLLCSLLLGGIICFYGKKLYFLVLPVFLCLGSVVFFSTRFGSTGKWLGIGLVVGIVLALLARFIYKLGVFMLGAVAGFMIGILITNFLPHNADTYSWIICIISSLIIAILSVKWCDFFIMISTALSGAQMMASSICFLAFNLTNLMQYIHVNSMISTMTSLGEYINGEFNQQYSMIILIATALLFFLGSAFQIKDNNIANHRR